MSALFFFCHCFSWICGKVWSLCLIVVHNVEKL
jgi:hypothetical protein